MSKEMLDFEGTLLRQTKLAIYFHHHESDTEEWLPKSQIAIPGEGTTEVIPNNTDVTVEVPEWLAIEKGFV